MVYKSLHQCITDLEVNGELRIISKESDPDLDLASIHLDEFAKGGKALLFENVKGSNYKVVSNLFGSISRSRYMFRHSLSTVKDLIEIKIDPSVIFKNPFKSVLTLLNGIYAIPKKVRFKGSPF